MKIKPYKSFTEFLDNTSVNKLNLLLKKHGYFNASQKKRVLKHINKEYIEIEKLTQKIISSPLTDIATVVLSNSHILQKWCEEIAKDPLLYERAIELLENPSDKKIVDLYLYITWLSVYNACEADKSAKLAQAIVRKGEYGGNSRKI